MTATTTTTRGLHTSTPNNKIKGLGKKKDLRFANGTSRDPKKPRHQVEAGQIVIVHGTCTLNNTVISVNTTDGKTLRILSPGCVGYKKAKRCTPLAAQEAAKTIAEQVMAQNNVRKVHISLNGIGLGRQGIVRGFQIAGAEIVSIADVTGYPHNGCRPPKARRL